MVPGLSSPTLDFVVTDHDLMFEVEAAEGRQHIAYDRFPPTTTTCSCGTRMSTRTSPPLRYLSCRSWMWLWLTRILSPAAEYLPAPASTSKFSG